MVAAVYRAPYSRVYQAYKLDEKDNDERVREMDLILFVDYVSQ
jgi:hypothetical protein